MTPPVKNLTKQKAETISTKRKIEQSSTCEENSIKRQKINNFSENSKISIETSGFNEHQSSFLDTLNFHVNYNLKSVVTNPNLILYLNNQQSLIFDNDEKIQLASKMIKDDIFKFSITYENLCLIDFLALNNLKLKNSYAMLIHLMYM